MATKKTKKTVKEIEKPVSKKRQLAIDIAKDVLKQLKAEKLNVHIGTYLAGELDYVPSDEDQIQKHLPAIEKTCHVCAKGAVFLSYIRLKNKVTFNDIDASGDQCLFPFSFSDTTEFDISHEAIMVSLKKAFDKQTLDLIEVAFEKATHFAEDDEAQITYDAEEFGRRINDPRERLVAIMKNIVANKGKFIPCLK